MSPLIAIIDEPCTARWRLSISEGHTATLIGKRVRLVRTLTRNAEEPGYRQDGTKHALTLFSNRRSVSPLAEGLLPGPTIELMVLNPSWPDILLRLLLVVAAGALIGFNRESGGHAAGFRTTILVGLAACLTMIQANILLATSGKSPESFASMDILRFPLGVLTGVGFIGGGAILKRGDLVTGVTTAATLWIVTAIGLCLGGGQLIIGSAGAILAFVVLSLFKWCDRLIPRKQKARIVIEVPWEASIAIPEIRMPGEPHDCTFSFVAKTIGSTPESANIAFEARWKWAGADGGGAQLLASLQVKYTIITFEMQKSTA